jgi:hypothetical protein
MSETDNTKNTEPTTVPVEAVAEAEELGKNFTQADIDKVVSDRVARVKRQYDKKYENVNIDTYHELVERQETEKQNKLKAKGEFEQLLKAQADKKDEQISQLLNTVKTIKVDGNLLDTASKQKAVNPQQVAVLLKDQVQITESGDVEIVDPKTKQVRYNEKGEHFGVSELVGEFLQQHPHFLSATPSGAGTQSKIGDAGSGEKLDISKLDMNNPEDRKVYSEYRKKVGISR